MYFAVTLFPIEIPHDATVKNVLFGTLWGTVNFDGIDGGEVIRGDCWTHDQRWGYTSKRRSMRATLRADGSRVKLEACAFSRLRLIDFLILLTSRKRALREMRELGFLIEDGLTEEAVTV